jgi:integrase
MCREFLLTAASEQSRAGMPDEGLGVAMTTDTGSLRALRNRAIVLVGLASAMRRSELIALNVDDVEWREGGIIIHIRQSKGDQGGEGQQVGVMKRSTACPVAALRAWLEAAAISEGPIFRRIRNKIAQRVTAERAKREKHSPRSQAGRGETRARSCRLRRTFLASRSRDGCSPSRRQRCENRRANAAQGFVADHHLYENRTIAVG